MLPRIKVPASFQALLAPLRVCFTAPTFDTFTAMVLGALMQTGRVTICGMLLGAGVATVWHHSRGHRFFASARWELDMVGVLLADLVVELLIPADAPLVVAIDDTLFRRTGRRVHAAAWLRDGSAKAPPDGSTLRWGNRWVVAGLLVKLPLRRTPICLPVLSRLWVPASTSRGHGRRRGNRTAAGQVGDSSSQLARDMIEIIGYRYPQRPVHVVLDAGFGCRELRNLPPNVAVTTRLRANTALWAPPPPRVPGRPGRSRTKGAKLASLTKLATTATWETVTVTCYGRTTTIAVAELPCLWYDVLLTQPARLVLARARTETHGYRIALLTTDLQASPAAIVERYAGRFSIEACFRDAKQVYGVGEAQNRTPQAVARTVGFGLLTMTLTTLWYATSGHDPADVTDRCAAQPWHRTKTSPSAVDMLAKLRRVVIAEQYRPEGARRRRPTRAETLAVQQSWAHAGT
jgi:DDE superfamily endonuclease